MAGAPTRLCPKCGIVVSYYDSRCPRCGANVLKGGRPFRYEFWFFVIHSAVGILALAGLFFARGTGLEMLSELILPIVGISLGIHQFRRPQRRVFEARRAARPLRGRRVLIVVAPKNRLSGEATQTRGRVVAVVTRFRDEIAVKADSSVSTTTNGRSDLLALRAIDPGDQFVNLLARGWMNVQILVVDRVYLLASRGRISGRLRLQRTPPLDVGPGSVFLEPALPSD